MTIATADATGTALPRLVYSVAETERLLCLSHATIYRLIGLGILDARKIAGTKTVITAASIERYLASLPSAQVRRRAAADAAE